MVLLRIPQHALERAGDDGFIRSFPQGSIVTAQNGKKRETVSVL